MGIMAGSSEPVSRTPKSVSLKGNCLPSAGGVTLEGTDKVAELALSVRSCAPNTPDEYHSLWNAIGEAWPSTGEKDLATAGSTGFTDTTSVG